MKKTPCKTCGNLVDWDVPRNRRVAFCSSDCRKRFDNSDDLFTLKTKKGENGCVEWQGATTTKGYGKLRVKKVYILAHRHSYGVFRGPVSDDIMVLHECDNRLCVNPTHLFLGTNTDNMRDASGKGRLMRGQSHSKAKVTDDEVRAIFAMREAGMEQADIGNSIGLSQTQVSRILRRVNWKHLVV